MTRPNTFAGALAPIVVGSLHPTFFLVGTLALGVAGGCAWLARAAGMPGAAVIVAAAALTLLVARTAQNAAYGDPDDALGTSGGSWGAVVATSARITMIGLAWTVPVGIVCAGWPSGWESLPRSGPALLVFVLAAVLGPLAVVMGIGSSSLRAALSPSSWIERSGGRGADLITLLAVTVGGTLMAATLATIVAVGLGSGAGRFGIFLGLVGAAWTLGVAIGLLGRVGGAFVRTAPAPQVVAAAPNARPLRPSDFDPHPSADGQDSGPFLVFGGTDHWTAERASGSAPASPVVDNSARVHQPSLSLSRPVAAVAELEPETADADSLLGRLRANLRIEEDDRDLALEDAEHLVGKFGPHPQVLARVAVLQHRLGLEEASATLQRAVQSARAVNNFGALADLYEEFRGEILALGLTETELQRMASSLTTRGHHDVAIDLYDAILVQTPRDLTVVKAMIQLAEDGLRTDEGAQRALRLYEVIESHWDEHPFVEFVDRGREEARRRRERITH